MGILNSDNYPLLKLCRYCLLSSDRKHHGAFYVQSGCRERILGYINTHKVPVHAQHLHDMIENKAGEVSRPILHDNEGSKTQPT